MQVRHKEFEIDKANPFKDCRLNRLPFANSLTQIIKAIPDGFVLAINNQWGAGKTTFIKMWKQSLENEGYKTLYFNAWENDFESSPLVAIMGELKTLIKSDKDEQEFSKIAKNAAIFTKNVMPTIVKGIASKFISSEAVTELIEKITNASAEMLEHEIDKFAEKKQNLVKFKYDLEALISKNSNGKPIIFFIDELDRCRPNYAVEVLENIKHFFSIKRIVFVLSIDKTQLSHSVKGVYGSSEINSDEYLKRFIDIEYQIPQPSSELFVNYLFSYFDFNFFFNDYRNNQVVFRHDRSDILNSSQVLIKVLNLNLRQIEKLFSYFNLVLNTFHSNNFIFPELVIYLIYIKQNHLSYFENLSNKVYNIEQLQNEFHKSLNSPILEKGMEVLYKIEAELIIRYNKGLSIKRQVKLIHSVETHTTHIPSVFEKLSDGVFLSYLQEIERNRMTNDANLDYVIHKVKLLDNLIIQ